MENSEGPDLTITSMQILVPWTSSNILDLACFQLYVVYILN